MPILSESVSLSLKRGLMTLLMITSLNMSQETLYDRIINFKMDFFSGIGIYGSLPKTSNTLNIRTPKITAKYNFKMFPKISNSG